MKNCFFFDHLKISAEILFKLWQNAKIRQNVPSKNILIWKNGNFLKIPEESPRPTKKLIDGIFDASPIPENFSWIPLSLLTFSIHFTASPPLSSSSHNNNASSRSMSTGSTRLRVRSTTARCSRTNWRPPGCCARANSTRAGGCSLSTARMEARMSSRSAICQSWRRSSSSSTECCGRIEKN